MIGKMIYRQASPPGARQWHKALSFFGNILLDYYELWKSDLKAFFQGRTSPLILTALGEALDADNYFKDRSFSPLAVADPFMAKFFCFSAACAECVGGESSNDTGRGKSREGQVKFGFSLVKGKANHPMEDYHVAKFTRINGHELGLFAVYDGHLGHAVPDYLQKHLFDNILREDHFWTDPGASISKAYEKTDQEILNSPNLGRGGSTAVTAILINGQRLWVANIGDSRGILSRGGQVIQMTIDHEPSTERGIIENKGGFVSNIPGDVPRVNGQLAVSRAFGDKSLKSHLRSDPDILDVTLDVNSDLLILASDGLWKVMSNQEAADIARKTKDPVKAAEQLTAEAVNRDSRDDISCIVVRFRN